MIRCARRFVTSRNRAAVAAVELAALFLFFAAGVAPAVHSEPLPTVSTRPVILFWTDKLNLVPHANYITPGIVLAPIGSNNPLSQNYLLEHGVVPLKWCPGQSLEKLSNAQILATWANIVRQGYVALGIDELGGFNFKQNARFASLLVQFHQEHPGVFIAVWSAGIIDPVLARAYKSSVNLVMIEAYGPWGLHQFERFFVRLNEARLFGIVHKCIFGLGIDDAAPPDVLKSWGAWANTPSDLKRQIQWIAKHAPDMAGIGFFAPYASDKMLQTADELAHEYFPEQNRVAQRALAQRSEPPDAHAPAVATRLLTR